ncbi:MAG TPA: uroporphyrinogen-III synthase [Candidatus Acidoferrum sp.]
MPEHFQSSLEGKRIVITRALEQSEALARELADRGATPIVFPLISFSPPEDFGPLDKAIDGIAQFDWIILTSARAVGALAQRALESGRSLVPKGSKLQVACVGPVTAEAAKRAKLSVDYVAQTHKGVALAEELGSRLSAAKVLLPRSDHANPDLPAALRRGGAAVTEVIAYRTVKPADVNRSTWADIANGEAHAVLLFSPSAVQNAPVLFGLEGLRAPKDKIAFVAVGPITGKALRDAHFAQFVRIVVAADTTAASVIETLEKYFAREMKAAPAGVKPA